MMSTPLPTEPVFVILGVDALIDMARTSLNVTGNCLASAVIARWENELPADQPHQALDQGEDIERDCRSCHEIGDQR